MVVPQPRGDAEIAGGDRVVHEQRVFALVDGAVRFEFLLVAVVRQVGARDERMAPRPPGEAAAEPVPVEQDRGVARPDARAQLVLVEIVVAAEPPGREAQIDAVGERRPEIRFPVERFHRKAVGDVPAEQQEIRVHAVAAVVEEGEVDPGLAPRVEVHLPEEVVVRELVVVASPSESILPP